MQTLLNALTPEDAEEILIGLSFRAKQDGIQGTSRADEIEQLGNKLSKLFETEFKLKTKGMFQHHLKRVTRVRVRT